MRRAVIQDEPFINILNSDLGRQITKPYEPEEQELFDEYASREGIQQYWKLNAFTLFWTASTKH